MEIVGNVKNYDWGKLGSNSEVAKLALLNSTKFQVNEQTPYSELWMGDHPSGPSSIKSNDKELSTVLSDKLPFLFKVLSIRKALSIQVHPNKVRIKKIKLGLLHTNWSCSLDLEIISFIIEMSKYLK